MSVSLPVHATPVTPADQGAARPSRPAVRWFIMRVAASLGGVLLACAALEAVLRCTWERDLAPKTIKAFKMFSYHRYDAAGGWRPKPNVHVVHDFFNARFTTNSRGLRGSREYAVPRLGGVRRVLVLGDSFAWGFGVEDHEVFTAVLERNMPDTEVINLGVTGYQLPLEFQYLQEEGMRYEPDVVVIAICQNDLGASPGGPFVARGVGDARRQKDPSGTSGTHLSRRLKRSLYRHSYLHAACVDGVNANKTLTRAAVRLGLKEELAGFERLDINLHAAMLEYPREVQESVERAKVDLLRFDSFLRKRGARLIIALIPSLQAVDRRALSRTLAYMRYAVTDFDLDKPYRMLERYATAHGIVVCSPIQDFRRLHHDGNRLFLRHDLHFNALGHRTFADALEPLLRRALPELPVSFAGPASSAIPAL